MASQMHFGVASSAMQIPDVYMLEQTRRAIGCAATWSEEGGPTTLRKQYESTCAFERSFIAFPHDVGHNVSHTVLIMFRHNVLP